MYLKNYGMEEMQISTLTFAISMEHWEEGDVGHEFYCTQYGGGDTMIIYLDGQYHVYRTKDGVDEKVGSFDSVEEVNEAIGWNP